MDFRHHFFTLPNFTAKTADFFPVVVAVGPVLYIAIQSVFGEMSMGILFAAALGIGLCGIALAVIFHGRIQHFGRASILVGTPVAVTALVSTLLAPAVDIALFGRGFELGTAGSFFLFACAAVLGSFLNAKSIARIFLLFVGSALVSLPLALYYYWGEGNSAGSWAYVPFLMSASVLILCLLYNPRANTAVKATYIVLNAVLFLGLFFFFRPSVFLLLFAALLLCTVRFALFARNDKQWGSAIFSAGAIGVLSIIFVVHYIFPASHVAISDVRPSMGVTERIIAPAYQASVVNMALGTGPGTFASQWELYKPVESNLAPFWDTPFEEGYSVLTTSAVTIGMVGILAIFFWPYLLVMYWWQRKKIHVDEMHPRDEWNMRISSSALALSLFAFAALFIDNPGLALFLFGGVCAGFILRVGQNKENSEVQIHFVKRVARAGVLAMLGVTLVIHAGTQGKSAFYYEKGMNALTQGAFVEAAAFLDTAAVTLGHPLYERHAARAHLHVAFNVARPANDSKAAQLHVSRATTLADRSTQSNFKDAQSWLASGAIYTSLVLAGVEQYEENALKTLKQAIQLSPQNPQPLYLSAVLTARAGDGEEALRLAKQAILLKPDYAEARQLIEQIQTK
jgi:hypothetical protein